MPKNRRLQNGDFIKLAPPGLEEPKVKSSDDYIHLENTFFHRSQKPRRTKGIKRVAGVAAALTLLSAGGMKSCSDTENTQATQEARDKARITWLAETSGQQLHFPAISQEAIHDTFQASDVAAEQNTHNHILRVFQNIPTAKGIEPQQLNLCASAFKTFATSPKGVCFAPNVPEACYTNFLDMALCMPSSDLQYLANNEIEKMLFAPEILVAKKLLLKSPTNTQDFAQRSFECGFSYKLHQAMLKPIKKHEGNVYFIYWDKTGAPTLSSGINLSVYHFLLKYIRFQNSSKIQNILYPNNPELRSKDRYIILTRDNLNTLTKYVMENDKKKLDNANNFKSLYHLNVHPQDRAKLDQYLDLVLSGVIRTAATDMGIGRQERGPELFFGTPDHPIPIEAPKVATDITFRGGSLRKSNDFRKAYCEHDWKTVREECVPGFFKSSNFWRRHIRGHRFSWRQSQIERIMNSKQNWFRRNTWIFGLLTLSFLVSQRKKIVQFKQKRSKGKI